MTPRVSIVDDDEKTRRILVEILRAEPRLQYVSDYGVSSVAVHRLPADRPDVVLMDINMPEPDGIECVRLLRAKMPVAQFLMLTVYESADRVFAALKAGATGYLLKNTPRDELVAGIEQIAQGASPMTGAIARLVVGSFAAPARAQSELEDLTPRERAVLELLTQGYLYKEIADRLQIGVTTVTTHIRHVYEKLHVRSRTEAVAKFLSNRPPG